MILRIISFCSGEVALLEHNNKEVIKHNLLKKGSQNPAGDQILG